jgi:hypothetical protein
MPNGTWLHIEILGFFCCARLYLARRQTQYVSEKELRGPSIPGDDQKLSFNGLS